MTLGHKETLTNQCCDRKTTPADWQHCWQRCSAEDLFTDHMRWPQQPVTCAGAVLPSPRTSMEYHWLPIMSNQHQRCQQPSHSEVPGQCALPLPTTKACVNLCVIGAVQHRTPSAQRPKRHEQWIQSKPRTTMQPPWIAVIARHCCTHIITVPAAKYGTPVLTQPAHRCQAMQYTVNTLGQGPQRPKSPGRKNQRQSTRATAMAVHLRCR